MCEGLTLQECMQCPSSKRHLPTAALQSTTKTTASHPCTSSLKVILIMTTTTTCTIAIRQNVAATATNSSETDTTAEPVRMDGATYLATSLGLFTLVMMRVKTSSHCSVQKQAVPRLCQKSWAGMEADGRAN